MSAGLRRPPGKAAGQQPRLVNVPAAMPRRKPPLLLFSCRLFGSHAATQCPAARGQACWLTMPAPALAALPCHPSQLPSWPPASPALSWQDLLQGDGPQARVLPVHGVFDGPLPAQRPEQFGHQGPGGAGPGCSTWKGTRGGAGLAGTRGGAGLARSILPGLPAFCHACPGKTFLGQASACAPRKPLSPRVPCMLRRPAGIDVRRPKLAPVRALQYTEAITELGYKLETLVRQGTGPAGRARCLLARDTSPQRIPARFRFVTLLCGT